MTNHESRIDRSRRTFLQAAGAAICFAPRALGAEDRRELPPIEFLAVSDTHLGYRNNDSAERRWEITAKELAAAPGRFVLHLGDVVDNGQSDLYPAYQAQAKTIGKPIHEVPGNHDVADALAKIIGGPIDRAVEYDWLRLLLLNNARRDSHDGFLTPEQTDWLDDQCQAAARADQLTIVAMHVPVHTNAHPDRGWYVKPDHGQKELYDTVARHSDRVLMMMHGHFHNGLRGWNDPMRPHEIAFPSALYNQDRKLEAQSAPGYNPQEFRPAFTHIAIRQGRIRMQVKPIQADSSVEKELPF